MTARALPCTIMSNATPSASFELAHALETANIGPRKPYRIEICAGAALLINIGMKNGVMRLAVPAARAFVTVS